MRRLIARRPSPAMTVAVLALFIAIGGTGYAALKLPKNSVGTKQLKHNAVSSSKVKNRSLLAKDFKAGQLPRGSQGAAGPAGPTGPQGPQGADGLGAKAPAASVLASAGETTQQLQGTILHADTELYDTDGLHNSDHPENLTAPVSGTYVVSATVDWDPNGTGYRRMSLLGPDGGAFASVAGPPLAGGAFTSQNPAGIVRLNAGESVEIEALQGSGGDLNAQISRFEMTFVGS
jgi:hypothetical protein